MVITKTGEYLLIYVGLANTQLKKGDNVDKGSIIGTLAKGDDERTFDLMLTLLYESKAVNINRWIDWLSVHEAVDCNR